MNMLKLSGSLVVGSFASAPSNPQAGEIYYNTVSESLQIYKSGSFVEVADEDLIGILDATPTNYTPVDPTVSGHLQGIDSALASSGMTSYSDAVFEIYDDGDATKKIVFQASAISTATTRTITMADANVNLDDVNTTKTKADNLITLSGVAANSTDLGTFTGVTIPDARTIKQALQALETSVETKAADADVIKKDGSVAFTGDQSMGGFKLTNLASGTASGDAVNKSQLDAVSSIIQNFEWQESCLSIELDSDNIVAPATGDRYLIAGIGLNDFAGQDNDIAEWDGAAWVFYTPTTGTFTSVDDESDGLYQFGGSSWTKKYFEATTASTGLTKVGFDVRLDSSAAGSGLGFSGGVLSVNVDDSTLEINTDTLRVKDAGITNAKVATGIDAAKIGDGSVSNTEFQYLDGVTSSIQTQINGKIGNVVEDTTPQLGGDLDVLAFAIESSTSEVLLAGQNSVRRAKQASKTSFVEEEYIHSIALLGSQSNTAIAALTVPFATVEGLMIDYKVKETTSNDIQIGHFMAVTNGTAVSYTSMSTETNPTGITFTAAINGSNLEIRYSSGSNGATMRADVKKIKA